MFVHPGCTSDHHHGCGSGCKDSACSAKHCEGGEVSHEDNLNLSSALLHLVTDVLRSITILAVAMLVELGCVTDAGKADAACAILVAFFVGAGSVELLRRSGMVIWKSFEQTPKMNLLPCSRQGAV